MSNKSKNHGNKPHPDPHQNSGQENERKIRGDIHVHGEVEANLPPDLVKQHKAERNEDAAQAQKNYIVQVVTLGVLILYASFTFWQGWLTRELITQTQRNFESDQAPVIWTSPQSPIVEVGEKLKWDVLYSNYGRSPAHNVKSCAWLAQGPVGLNALQILPQPSARSCDNQSFRSIGMIPQGVPPSYVSALSPVPLTESDVATIKSVDGGAIIYGVISYDDSVGHSYESTFCYYRLATKATMNCEKYNSFKRIR